MINEKQAEILKENGLTAYNHNIDTSREHYPNVVTTRTYDERLETIKNVQKLVSKLVPVVFSDWEKPHKTMFRFVHFVQHESAPRIIANQQISSNPGYPIVEVLKMPQRKDNWNLMLF